MNLTFFNPFWLWVLPLSLFPVLLHLFFQKKPKKIIFSDLRFIKLAVLNVVPRKQLHKLLLLILRCLILLLLILTLARPIGFIGYFGERNETQKIIILVDVSYSMQYMESGISRLTKLKSFLKNIVDKLLPTESVENINKQLCIVLFSDHIENRTANYFTNDKQYLFNFIDNIEPSYHTTDLLNGLAYCYKIFSENSLNKTKRTIIIISDMCKHTIDEYITQKNNTSKFDIKSIIPEIDKTVKLVFLTINTGENDNTYIEKVELENQKIITEIKNFENKRIKWELTMYSEDIPVLTDLLELPPNKSTKYETNYTIKQKNIVPGNIKLQEDNLPSDNKYYFLFEPQQTISILAVDGDPKFGQSINSETYYLKTALTDKNNTGKSIFIVNTVTIDEFKYTSIREYDVIILSNVDIITPEKADELKDFIHSGDKKTLIITVGDKFNPDNYPNWISENIGSTIKGEFRIIEIDKKFMSDYDKFEINKIIFRQIFKLFNLTEIIKLNSGTPLMIEKNINNNKLIIFGSSIDMDWTNFPSKPLYPYFLRSLIKYNYIQAKTNKTMLTIGDPIIYNYDEKVGKTYATIIDPDGIQHTINIRNLSNQIVYKDTNKPGIYQLQFNNKIILYAVNLDRTKNENDLTKLSDSQLKDFFSGFHISILNLNNNSETDILNIIDGKELTNYFIILALFLISIEVIVSKL